MKHNLSIPEENLEDFITIVKIGLQWKNVDKKFRQFLEKWAEEKEEEKNPSHADYEK